jgi:hypothetical protein
MTQYRINFESMAWESPMVGVRFKAYEQDGRRLRLVEFTKDFVEFTDRFKARHGSVKCRQLLGCDISTPEGMVKAQDNELFVAVCPKMVQEAGEILEEMLEEE